MANEAKECENADDHTLKKGRHRKKQLYNSILQQMEFYFSDSNLTKDRFLSQLLQKDLYVDLEVFLKFNKIRKLTSSIEDIQKAVKNSKLIELSDDRNKIRRLAPVKEKPNVDECTIYVERLKSDATHEWLTSVFSEFGTVVYVSIPKYKGNNAIKGFAFVEFDTEGEALKALNYFESIGCKMPSTTEAEQLCSIQTFEGEGEEKKGVKRKFDEVGDEEVESDDVEKKRKKKKEHKKKNLIKDLGLQILSKKEWKKMRNRYLDLQKKRMKEFKKHLHRAKYGQGGYECEKNGEEKSKKELNGDKNGKEEKEAKYEFTEGVIVKMKLSEPVSDLKKFKNDIKASAPEIQYVDIPNIGSSEVFLRFDKPENALNFCQDSSGKKFLLKGDEEKSYWTKIQDNRDAKFKKAKKKQRGRDKLLEKAKHTKFDE